MARTIMLVALLLVPPAATAIASKALRYPKRFAEVIPGRLYRGGFPSARQIRNLRRDLNIKTIVSLTDTKDQPKYLDEQRVASELGIRIRRFRMPGNGCGDFAKLDMAADAVAQTDDWPTFFHCNAGKQRSNAVLAAYRMRNLGWSLSQAMEELEDDHDFDHQAEKVLADHLAEYAQWLAASGRQTKTPGR
jgi:protein tyrosine/serine phosphatase